MRTGYERRLEQELSAVGISGRLRRRILTEVADHLACDPDAQLGDPRELARQFADELGSARARRAALASFGALALTGTLFAVAFLLARGAAFGPAPAGAPALGRLASLIAVVAPQLAFVAGGLAALRVFRRRAAGVLAGAEATIIVRRAAVGALAGLASMAALGVMALEYRRHVLGSWVTFAAVAAAVGIAALAVAVPPIVAAMRVGPAALGPAGDVFDDLGGLTPAALRGRPWRFALATAAAVALAITLNGVLSSGPFDGAVLGIGDALVCLVGFATLGRYLGLWTPHGHRRSPAPS